MITKLKIIHDRGRFGLSIYGIIFMILSACASHQPETQQKPKPQGNRTTLYVLGYEIPVYAEATLPEALAAAQRDLAGTRDSIIRWKENYYELNGAKIDDIKTFLNGKTP